MEATPSGCALGFVSFAFFLFFSPTPTFIWAVRAITKERPLEATFWFPILLGSHNCDALRTSENERVFYFSFFFFGFLSRPFAGHLKRLRPFGPRCCAQHKSSPFSFKAKRQRASRLLRAQLSGIFHGSFSWAGVPGGLRGPHCVPDCVSPLCGRPVNSGGLVGTGRRQESDTGSSLRGACWLARHLSPLPPSPLPRRPHSPPSPRLILAFFVFFKLSLFVTRSHKTAAASHVFNRPGQSLGGDEKRRHRFDTAALGLSRFLKYLVTNNIY